MVPVPYADRLLEQRPRVAEPGHVTAVTTLNPVSHGKEAVVQDL